MRRHRRAAGLAFALAALALPLDAQIPDRFENLRVLPETITKDELVSTMRGFASALGVRCNHCHVGPENLQGMDFATDEKATKRVARAMLRMVRAVNADYLAGLDTGRETRVEVTCATCHRGVSVPRAIEEIFAETLAQDGLDAAKAKYAELKGEYAERGAYDFGPVPLNRLAERTFEAGDRELGLTIVRYNNELFPDYPWSRTLEAELLVELGREAEALAAFAAALELEPGNPWIERQIERLRGQAPERRDSDGGSR